MAEPGDKKRGLAAFIDAFRSYAEERKRPRVCPACGHEVAAIPDGKLFVCQKVSCGWQGPFPDRG